MLVIGIIIGVAIGVVATVALVNYCTGCAVGGALW